MANEALQYMQAFQSGYQAPVDMANYPAQQAANTEILRQQALQSAQQVQLNDHTIKANMAKLLASEKAAKQEEELSNLEAAEFAKAQTGGNQLFADQTAANSVQNLYQTMESVAAKLAATPGGAARAQELLKSAADLQGKVAATNKTYTDTQKDQISVVSSVLSSIKDQASLDTAAARLKAMKMYPPDMPTTWDGRAEKWTMAMVEGATSAAEKAKLKSDLAKAEAQTASDWDMIRHRKAQEGLEQQRINLQKEKLSADKAADEFDRENLGTMNRGEALKMLKYFNGEIQSTVKQLKLPEMLALVDNVNETFIGPDGKLKPLAQRAGVDTSALMAAYYKANKPGALGSNLTLQQMNADIASLPIRVGDKLISLGMGKTLDDSTIKAVINNIRAKAKSVNDEVARIEDSQINKLVEMGMNRKFAETQLRGSAYRAGTSLEAGATKGSFENSTPAIQELVKEQMRVTGIKDPNLVYDLLKQRKMIQ